MSGRERRRYGRTESLNLLDNIVLGETGEMVAHQMGRTINISENGLMLETHIQFKPKHLLVITLALGENLILRLQGTALRSSRGPRFERSGRRLERSHVKQRNSCR